METETLEALQAELKSDVRQALAVERTVLANERTFMAYVRTAVALFVTGLSMQHFTQTKWVVAVAALFIAAGVIMGWYGWRLYSRRKNQINHDKRLLGLRLLNTDK